MTLPKPASMELFATAYIALGSNLGDRKVTIDSAIASLRHTAGIEVSAMSQIFETAAVGPAGQGPYLNAAAELRTSLTPRGLLNAFLAIESAHGRVRRNHERWGPRVLDIDLLLYDLCIIDEPGLHVPHPRLAERAFVLVPLAQIAPAVIHPGLGHSIQFLLDHLIAQAPSEYSAVAPCC